MGYDKFNEYNIAPYVVKQIGVYNSSGERVGKINLNSFKPNFGTRLYRFGLLSDTHYQSDQTDENDTDFENALTFFNNKESVWATIIAGDILYTNEAPTCNTELAAYKSNVDTKSPDTPVYTVGGNHDIGGLNSGNWTTYTGCEKTFELTKENDHFLFVSLASYSFGTSGTPFNTADLDWLENKLESYRNERCFVIQHLFFPEWAGNFISENSALSYPTNTTFGGAQCTRLQNMVDHYKNTVWFNGHSHYSWKMQNYSKHENIYRHVTGGGWDVHIPSCASPRTLNCTPQPTQSEGAIVDVYDNCIDIRGVDLKNGKYIPIAQYRLDTTLVNVPAMAYTVTNNLTYVENANTATSAEKNSSYVGSVSPSSGYYLGTVTVTMGVMDITSTAYNSDTGLISISTVTGAIVITASATMGITITNNLSNCSTSNTATSIVSGNSYNATLSFADGYNDFLDISVNMGGADITSAAYNATTHAISISSVTGNVTITATAIHLVYKVDFTEFTDSSPFYNYSFVKSSASATNANTLVISAQNGGLGKWVTISDATVGTHSLYIRADNITYSSTPQRVGLCYASYDASNNKMENKEYVMLSSGVASKITNASTTQVLGKVGLLFKASSYSASTFPFTITVSNLKLYYE